MKASDRRCALCGRRATFSHHGKVKADKDHDLCPRCYTRTLDQMRADRLKKGRRG